MKNGKVAIFALVLALGNRAMGMQELTHKPLFDLSLKRMFGDPAEGKKLRTFLDKNPAYLQKIFDTRSSYVMLINTAINAGNAVRFDPDYSPGSPQKLMEAIQKEVANENDHYKRLLDIAYLVADGANITHTIGKVLEKKNNLPGIYSDDVLSVLISLGARILRKDKDKMPLVVQKMIEEFYTIDTEEKRKSLQEDLTSAKIVPNWHVEGFYELPYQFGLEYKSPVDYHIKQLISYFSSYRPEPTTWNAIEEGINRISNLLQLGANPAGHIKKLSDSVLIDKLDEKGKVLLERLVDTLSEKGTSINDPTEIGYTPLAFPALMNNYPWIALLIKKGALIDKANSDGSTVLDLINTTREGFLDELKKIDPEISFQARSQIEKLDLHQALQVLRDHLGNLKEKLKKLSKQLEILAASLKKIRN